MTSPATRPVSRRPVAWILAAAVAVELALIAWVLLKGLQLRPGGDDYCWAVGAGYGIVGGPVFWWETFAGYLVHDIALTYLVGIPLLHLPLALASVIPFAIAAAAVALAVIFPLWSVRGSGRAYRLGMAALVPALVVSWWAYWWFPMTFNQDGPNRWLAIAMTHNQNINGGYVVETTVAIILWFAAWLLCSRRGVRWIWVPILAGAWSAFSGPAIAVASGLMLVAAAVWTALVPGSSRNTRLRIIVAGLASVALCSLIAHLAPGTQARAARMGTELDLSPLRIGELVNHTVPEAVIIWIEGLISPGAAVVVALVAATTLLLSRAGFRVPASLLARLGLAALTFGLMLAISSRLTNFFIYEAPYHSVPSRIATFAALWWLGMWLGTKLAAVTSGDVGAPAAVLALFAALLVATGSLLTMTISIAERAVRWDQGSAPVTTIVMDILEWPGGRTCWQDLVQIRPDLPTRNQPPPPYRFDFSERVPELT